MNENNESPISADKISAFKFCKSENLTSKIQEEDDEGWSDYDEDYEEDTTPVQNPPKEENADQEMKGYQLGETKYSMNYSDKFPKTGKRNYNRPLYGKTDYNPNYYAQYNYKQAYSSDYYSNQPASTYSNYVHKKKNNYHPPGYLKKTNPRVHGYKKSYKNQDPSSYKGYNTITDFLKTLPPQAKNQSEIGNEGEVLQEPEAQAKNISSCKETEEKEELKENKIQECQLNKVDEENPLQEGDVENAEININNAQEIKKEEDIVEDKNYQYYPEHGNTSTSYLRPNRPYYGTYNKRGGIKKYISSSSKSSQKEYDIWNIISQNKPSSKSIDVYDYDSYYNNYGNNYDPTEAYIEQGDLSADLKNQKEMNNAKKNKKDDSKYVEKVEIKLTVRLIKLI